MVNDVFVSSHLRCDWKILDNFPIEVIFLIIEWLSPEEIITLGCVNQRLNSISFAAYFSPQNQPSSEGSLPLSPTHYAFRDAKLARVYHPFYTLKALRLAFYEKQEVTSVSLYFGVDKFVEEANYAQSFLRNARRLRRVRLILPDRITHQSWKHADGSPKAKLSEVYDAFVRLLKSLHCIPQLNTLDIEGSIPVPESTSTVSPQDIPLPIHVSSVNLEDCDCLSSPSLVDWSIHALNTMPIRAIGLHRCTLLSHEDRIQMPFVKDMRIYSPPSAFDIGAFLSRHPTINSFIFRYQISALQKDCMSFQKGALPQLACLKADMDHINIWLARDSVMPQLHSLTALIPNRLLGGPHRAEEAAVLTKEMLSLVAKRPSITSVALPLCQLMSEDFFPADQDLSHINDLQVDATWEGKVPADIEQFISAVKFFTGIKVLRLKNATLREEREWRETVKPKLAEHCPQWDFKI